MKISKNTCLEGTSLAQTASFEPSCVRIGCVVWAVGWLMNRGHYIYILNELRKSQRGSISRLCGGGTMYPTTMNFAKVNEVPIVIIYTKFGEDRSISLVSAGSRISPLCLHLTTSHYNIACTTVQLVIWRPRFINQPTAQTTQPILTHNGSNDAVWAKEVPSKQVFFDIFTSSGSFPSKTSKISPPVRKSQPKRKKCSITFYWLKIDQKF